MEPVLGPAQPDPRADASDCDALRVDPAFKLGVGRLPESGADRCSQPTISRLAGNQALLARVADMAEAAALGRGAGEGDKVRRFGEFRYAAKTGQALRRVIARIEASAQGTDTRFIVTNLKGAPRWLYEAVDCARGQAENLIKAHKLHLASDRTSCTKATANQFRLLIHTAAYWLLHTLRGLAPKTSFWRDAQFDTLRLALIKIAARVTELKTRIRVALPTCYPHQQSWALLTGRATKLPP